LNFNFSLFGEISLITKQGWESSIYIKYCSEQTAKRGKRHEEEEEAESLAQANIRRVA
jgi:hypothetical protein